MQGVTKTNAIAKVSNRSKQNKKKNAKPRKTASYTLTKVVLCHFATVLALESL